MLDRLDSDFGIEACFDSWLYNNKNGNFYYMHLNVDVGVEAQTLVSLLQARARMHPNKTIYTFLADGEDVARTVTYGELDRLAQAVAVRLTEMNAFGERALMLYPSGIEFIISFFGCLYAGVIGVPAYPPRNNQNLGRLQSIINDCAPKLVICTSKVLAMAKPMFEDDNVSIQHKKQFSSLKWLATDTIVIDEAEEYSALGVADLEGMDGDSLAFLQYTSGSTGSPKGVMISHGNLMHNEAMIRDAYQFSGDSVFASWLPLFHDMGLIGTTLQPLYVGSSAVLMSPAAFLQKPVRWLQCISDHSANVGVAPNFAFELCVKRITDEQKVGLDLSCWKWALSGSEVVRHNTLVEFAKRFADVGFSDEAYFPTYGLAEATLYVSGGYVSGGNVSGVSISGEKSSEIPSNKLISKEVSAKQLQLNHVTPASKKEHSEGGTIHIVGNGRPQLEGSVAIVDPRSKKRLSSGDVGEIWVKGPHVSKGYWGREKESKEVFNAHIEGEVIEGDVIEGEALGSGDESVDYLRTGDLGCLLEGILYITGREKDVLIIRGRNHYPQDIENTVQLAHVALKADAGAAFSVEVDGEEQLVVVQELERNCWRSFDKLVNEENLVYTIRKAVAEQHELQLHSICFLKPGKILKTSSGKIQRRGNKQAYIDGTLSALGEAKREVVSEKLEGSFETRLNLLALSNHPKSDWQQQLTEYLHSDIASTLRISPDEVSDELSLTELGLDSLAMTQIASGLRENFFVELEVQDLFEVDSVSELAKQVLLQINAGVQSCEVIPASIQQSNIPLSYSQQRLWFIEQLEPGNTAYNLPVALEISGHLKSDLLSQSFEEIISRHEILRTAFCSKGGVAHQIINDVMPWSIPFEDISYIPGIAKTSAIQGMATAELSRPFNFEEGVLLRAKLLRLSKSTVGGKDENSVKNEKHVLLITAHHIVADGWSMGVFVNELSAIYQSLCTHTSSGLKKPSIQYKDYAVWQRKVLDDAALENQVVYWREKLANVSVLELPADRVRLPERSGLGADVHLTVSEDLTQKLKSLAKKQGVTLFMVLLSSFKVLMHRYSGSDDICVGSPIANRTRAQLDNLIGFFVNTLALRTTVTGDLSFNQLLSAVRHTTLEAYSHQHVPFERLVDELVGKRDMSYTPLFQVMFTMQNSPLNLAGLKGDLEFKQFDIHTHTSNFDLSLTVDERVGGIKAIFEYSTDLFNAETIERLAAHWENLLSAFVNNPEQLISSVDFLESRERTYLIEELNDNAGTFSQEKSLHLLFEEQVARTPNAIAVAYEGKQWTYSAINARANQVARQLQSLGVINESLVGVCTERNPDIVVALLAVLKAGGAYVPIDPAYPADRVQYMLDDSRVNVVLSNEHCKSRFSLRGVELLCLDTDSFKWEGNDVSNLGLDICPSQLCYVIYTSGSTGKPKGVAIEHRNSTAMVQWAHTVYPLQDLKGVLFSTSICFDLSVWEIFVTLTCGGTVIVAENALSLPRLVEKNQVTLINTVPSAIASLCRDKQIPASVTVINLAGEPLQTSLVDSLYELTHLHKVYDLYGPSEDTTYSTFALRKPKMPATIGRPILNTAAYVVDRYGQLVPKGFPGELCLAGWGIARGYLNQEELTAEKFVKNPFKHEEGYGRLYKTGDMVRVLSDGSLQYLGRTDYQVKLRGFRIELGEIENALKQHVAVRECLVIIREPVIREPVINEPDSGEKSLVAYWVAHNDFNKDGQFTEAVLVNELRAIIKNTLPDYMVPAAFVKLDKFPLTANGKVDRQQLPIPALTHHLTTKFVAPNTAMEVVIASIWRGVLHQDAIGVNDDFFHLGGHSLLATQVVSRIRDEFNVELIVRDIFKAPTISALVDLIEVIKLSRGRGDGKGDGHIGLPEIKSADRNIPVPLSSAQQRLWFMDQLESGTAKFKISTAYNMSGVIKLTGELNIHALKYAFSEVVKRHDVLRTNVKIIDGQITQVVRAVEPGYLDVIDLTNIKNPEQYWRVNALMLDESSRAFDIEINQNAQRMRLMRTRLIKLAEHEYILLVTLHHIVSDGWSMGVLVNEVAELYDAKLNRRAAKLPALPIQYADYAVWQQDLVASGVFRSQEQYWCDQLRDVPVLKLPTDRSRPPVQTPHGSRVSFTIDNDLTDGLYRFSQEQGVTLFMALLAVFELLLHRYSHQDDFCVGTPIANRTRAELEPLIGCFVNTLVLRAQFHENLTVQQLMSQVREVTLGAYTHQDLPFEVLVDKLGVERDMSRTPLFQVMFSLQNTPQDHQLQLTGIEIETLTNKAQTAKFDMALNLSEVDGEIVGDWEFNTDLFDRETIEAMIGHYQHLLLNIIKNAGLRVDDIAMLPQEEELALTQHLQCAHNKEYEQEICLHQLFEQQVSKNPNAIALSWNKEKGINKSITYKDLNAKANQLAHMLIDLGVGPDLLVGVCFDRSIDMIVSMLAVLKAGGAYLPIDPSNPVERIAYILRDGLSGQNVKLLISHNSAIERCIEAGSDTTRTLNVDELKQEIEQQSSVNPSVMDPITKENRAYVIYTSGTTGKPKGVLIAHKNATRLFKATEKWYEFDESDVWTLFHSFAFDFTVWEIWGALLYGGRLVIVPQEIARSTQEFYQLLLDENVTVLNQTPSAFSQLIKVDGDFCDKNDDKISGEQNTADDVDAVSVDQKKLSLRVVIFGGEALDFAALQEWQQRHGLEQPRLVNMFGITETTVHATYYPVTEKDLFSTSTFIGEVIPDMQVVLLDPYMRPVPVGVPGEIYVGGAGVSQGYLHQPSLTNERFIDNPFKAGEQLYKSGDLARWTRPEATMTDEVMAQESRSLVLEYLGRIDDQVKIRGYRIELGEIESTISLQADILENVVIAREDEPGDKRLVAYFVPSIELAKNDSAEGEFVQSLRVALKRSLPDYMVPSAFVRLDTLPLTANGKVDRKKLPKPTGGVHLSVEVVPPRNGTELGVFEIWKSVLGLTDSSSYGVYDNFFDVGGNSLLAMQIVSRIRENFDVELALGVLFDQPTIENIALHIVEAEVEGLDDDEMAALLAEIENLD